MAIQSDEQLRVAAMQAGELLQDIQNYAERQLRDDAKVSFPRGLMKTNEEYRQECPGYLTQLQKSSCAYGFMYLDGGGRNFPSCSRECRDSEQDRIREEAPRTART